MIVKIYSVYDCKAGAFGTINAYRSSDEAVRAFGVACNDSSSNYFKFAEDFTLFELGEYDDTTGLLKTFSPISVISATAISRAHNEYYASRNITQSVS